MKAQYKTIRFNKLFLLFLALCLGIFTGFHLHTAFAMDIGDDSQEAEESISEDESPAYNNPAQAQHAANLAAEAASMPDEQTEAALTAVEEAEAALTEAEQNGTPEDIEAARANLEKAEEAYTDLIAERTGVLSMEIADMRSSGMGWGEIAHELGVHPGLLGLGHTKRSKHAFEETGMDEVSEATARNTKSGWSKGHGVGLNGGVVSTSKSKGYAYGLSNKGDKGKKGGISGASGLSSGRGGGQGKGHGGDSGNGKGGVASSDGSPGNSGNGGGQGGGKSDKGNKGGNSGGKGKGGGKGK